MHDPLAVHVYLGVALGDDVGSLACIVETAWSARPFMYQF